MFYGRRAKKRLYIVKGLYLLSCSFIVAVFVFVLFGMAIVF